MKKIKWMYWVLVVLIFLYFILGETLLPTDVPNVGYDYEEFNDGWMQIHEDGTYESITIPSKCKNGIVIENTLPQNIGLELSYLCFRGEDTRIYIGDELRLQYDTTNQRFLGKVSPEVFLFVPIYQSDRGKTITIYSDQNFGQLYDMYLGSQAGIWKYMFQQFGSEIIISFLSFVMGLLSIFLSKSLQKKYGSSGRLDYLGAAVCFASVWLITNSVFRQIFFQNISTASDIPFLMVSILPCPFMFYLDVVQKKRYHYGYVLLSLVNILGSFLMFLLYVLSIRSLGKSFKLIAMICILSCGYIIATIIIDIFRKKIKEYITVAVGLLCMCIMSAIEVMQYFNKIGLFGGSLVGIGLLMLLISAAISMIGDFFEIERDKQRAITENEARGKFLANMSHEIRTPINAIMGMDMMILRETENKEVLGYAQDIYSASENLLDIVNDILDISKIDEGKMDLIPVEYGFSSLLHDVQNMISMKAQSKGLELKLDFDRDIPSVLYGDEIRVRQILLNILNNAVKYTDRGSVTFKVRKKEMSHDSVILYFEIQDTGIGIKEEDIERLFIEYQRIDEERNRHIEGTGLGMSITMNFLKMMNSTLKVESTYGLGSRFYFELKQGVIDAEPIGDLDKRLKETETDHTYYGKFTAPQARVLVVDDNDTNRKVFMNLLKETKIFIDEAASGEAAINMVERIAYDMIFLDHMMPGMDGVETLQLMLQNEIFMKRKVPVIAMTANAISGAKDRYKKLGFDDYVSKPVVPEKLDKVLLKYLSPEKVHLQENKKNKKERSYHYSMPGVNAAELTSKSKAGSKWDWLIDEISNMTEINLSYAAQFLPDRDTYGTSLKDYYLSMPHEAKQLEEFFDKKDWEDYRIKVHSMKSTSGMIGAMELWGYARILEKAAIAQDSNSIITLTPVFLEEWNRLERKLEVIFLQEQQDEQEKTEFQKDSLKHSLDILCKAMEEMDVDTADEEVENMKQYLYPEKLNPLLTKLFGAVSMLEQKKAAEIAEEIIKALD